MRGDKEIKDTCTLTSEIYRREMLWQSGRGRHEPIKRGPAGVSISLSSALSKHHRGEVEWAEGNIKETQATKGRGIVQTCLRGLAFCLCGRMTESPRTLSRPRKCELS